MTDPEHDVADAMINLLAEHLSERLAPKVAELLGDATTAETPWMTTVEAIEYSRLPEGTFRKLAASGKIPSHGGRSKLFYRPELDQTLLELHGMAEDHRRLRTVR